MLEHISDTDMREVVRIASELYEDAAQTKATVQAANEAGIPQEMLEQAARILAERRTKRAGNRNRNLFLLFAALCIPVGAVLATTVSVFTIPFSALVFFALSATAVVIHLRTNGFFPTNPVPPTRSQAEPQYSPHRQVADTSTNPVPPTLITA